MKTSTLDEELKGDTGSGAAGSQTLMRGLDVLEAVAHDVLALPELAARIGLTKSTTHRLASALTERGYLAFTPRSGYRLGAKLLELGHLAHEQAELIQVSRPHLEELAALSEDTVHLGILDGDQALYLDKIPGRRRVSISSRVGERQPLSSTGLGKALMIDHPTSYWSGRFAAEQPDQVERPYAAAWHQRMAEYSAAGRAFDLEENEHQIRCVAAPIRDARGAIVGAISVSSAALYMSDDRLSDLAGEVQRTARAISHDLGWTGNAPNKRAERRRVA